VELSVLDFSLDGSGNSPLEPTNPDRLSTCQASILVGGLWEEHGCPFLDERSDQLIFDLLQLPSHIKLLHVLVVSVK
jgi:hypothetical protein